VYGDGTQTRSFQYISDLVAGIIAVMDGPQIGPFNIGNPGEFTMVELANLVGGAGALTRQVGCTAGAGAPPARCPRPRPSAGPGSRRRAAPPAASPTPAATHPQNAPPRARAPARPQVKEVVAPGAVIEFRENTADDPSRRRPDITKAKTTLGWEPKVALRDGLALMVDDFKHRLHVQ
jgi:nucleoside-diphosphate-sugar epimerase